MVQRGSFPSWWGVPPPRTGAGASQRLSSTVPLTGIRYICIRMHMRTTLNIDTALLKEAGRLTGVSEKTALVRMGLQALIAKESAKRLAALGGTEKGLAPIRRRRSARVVA